jgi:hypothetical protein
VYLLIVGLAFQGLSGLLGGIGLIVDPTGTLLQIPVEWLDGSPFESYLIPGLVLLLVLGIGPLAVLYGLWRRASWAWLGARLVSVALLVWIGVEVLVIGYQPEPPLQLIYGLLGVVLLAASLVPSVRWYCGGAPSP